jgi:phage gp16-like protein
MSRRALNRRALMAKLQVARHQLGMDDDAYRLLIARHGASGDPPSSTTLSDDALVVVVTELEAKGWKPAAPRRSTRRQLATEPLHLKIRALWRFLHEIGVVRHPDEKSLAAYCKRLTGVEDLHWINLRQAERLVESLKKWGERELPARLEARRVALVTAGCLEDRHSLDHLIGHVAGRLSPAGYDALHATWNYFDGLEDGRESRP